MDRWRSTRRASAMADGVRAIAALPDPVGEVIDGFRLPNGLDVRKVRVPLGVVAVVYEARPNVTIDAAALALKSGNAVVLRGSSSAAHSNAVLASVAAGAALEAGLPDGALALVAGGGREELTELATQAGVVDLIIPRGGEGLKAALSAVATVPVIYAASGNCHVYVDASADLDDAEAIV
jgi:glutamate-5-semialdehyde dehydrogenase